MKRKIDQCIQLFGYRSLLVFVLYRGTLIVSISYYYSYIEILNKRVKTQEPYDLRKE